MAGFFFVLDAAGWQYGELLAATDPVYRQATTACLAGIVLAQVANVFVCRDPRRPGFTLPLGDNPLLVAGIALELGLLAALVYSDPGNRLFGTAPLAAEVWLWLLPFALLLGLAEEGRKWLLRRRAEAALRRPLTSRPAAGK
jgi:sodium/potassium-transporting ATPase subunit alpha